MLGSSVVLCIELLDDCELDKSGLLVLDLNIDNGEDAIDDPLIDDGELVNRNSDKCFFFFF